VFTYALYPHAGDPVAGGVIPAAYALNVPLRVAPVVVGAGHAPATASLLQLDTPAVVIEAVKQAEDDDDIVIRLYEATGATVAAKLSFGMPVSAVAESDLMETPLRDLALADGGVALTFGPFEIKTLRVTR
jgi:alpha-mannosidase